jgi:hypothetical protein
VPQIVEILKPPMSVWRMKDWERVQPVQVCVGSLEMTLIIGSVTSEQTSFEKIASHADAISNHFLKKKIN